MTNSSYSFKVIVIGDGAVGKTSLIKRFVHDTFNKEYINTLGSEITKYSEIVEDVNVNLIFWDLAGQSGFSRIRENFFKGSNAAIVVFSHEETDLGEQSFRNMLKWLQDVYEHCGRIPLILFGNKVDLVDENELTDNKDLPQSDRNLNKLAKDMGFLAYFKTSALTGSGVQHAFKTLIKELYFNQRRLEEHKVT
ncbi:MAG: GTP-binding protein [Candidatus Lokiarchaeota archaeon]|nr:GTP-binding protein [Candidatus Lokiarchaeota archaeon]